MYPPADQVKFVVYLTSLDSRATCRSPSDQSHLKLHQFGHELLDSLAVVCQRGAEPSPARHDGVHLGAIPTGQIRGLLACDMTCIHADFLFRLFPLDQFGICIKNPISFQPLSQRTTRHSNISRVLLLADVCRGFLKDLLHSRGQVVHLPLVFGQSHLEGLEGRDRDDIV